MALSQLNGQIMFKQLIIVLLPLFILLSYSNNISTKNDKCMFVVDKLKIELHKKFTKNDKKELFQRKNKIKKIFSKLSPDCARKTKIMLGKKETKSPTSILFHRKLATPTRKKLLKVLQVQIDKESSLEIKESRKKKSDQFAQNKYKSSLSRASLLIEFDRLVNNEISKCQSEKCIHDIITQITMAACTGDKFCHYKNNDNGSVEFKIRGNKIYSTVFSRYRKVIQEKYTEFQMKRGNGPTIGIPIPLSKRILKSPQQITREQLKILTGPFFGAVVYSGLNPNYRSNKHKKAYAAARLMNNIFKGTNKHVKQKNLHGN